MVLFGISDLWEETSVEFERRCQVVERLFEVVSAKIGFAKLCEGRYKYEKVLFMNVDQKFAKGKLLDSDLDFGWGV